MALHCLELHKAQPIHAGILASLKSFASLLSLLCCHLMFGSALLHAQALTPEYKTKAGLLKTFPGYVKWPGDREGPIKVGILGQDDLDGAVDSLSPKRSSKIEDLKDCQMIFISKSELARLPAILSSLEGTNILTVGETEGFAKQGGVIGFVQDEEKKTRFEINIAAARRAGITFDMRLLRLVLHLLND